MENGRNERENVNGIFVRGANVLDVVAGGAKKYHGICIIIKNSAWKSNKIVTCTFEDFLFNLTRRF